MMMTMMLAVLVMAAPGVTNNAEGWPHAFYCEEGHVKRGSLGAIDIECFWCDFFKQTVAQGRACFWKTGAGGGQHQLQ